jgi:alpha-tubulin suppressor-like RCC1 family protein
VGAAYCWGKNLSGEVGDGTLLLRTEPVAVTGGVAFAVLAPAGSHTCGLSSTGVAYCWGWNLYGQLGDGTTTDRSTPAAVRGDLVFSTQ